MGLEVGQNSWRAAASLSPLAVGRHSVFFFFFHLTLFFFDPSQVGAASPDVSALGAERRSDLTTVARSLDPSCDGVAEDFRRQEMIRLLHFFFFSGEGRNDREYCL